MNPTLTLEQALDLIGSKGSKILPGDRAAWIGLRWKDSVYGEKDAYTDSAILLTPDGIQTFKFNTLPTSWTQDIACLVPGVYRWKKGLHGLHHLDLGKAADKEAYDWLMAHVGEDYPDPAYRLTYWAFREVPPMTVIRCGHSGTFTDSADAPFFIDGHHGGVNTTSSAACQTWPVPIWKQVRAAGYAAMDKYGQKEIPYVLELVD